MALVLPSRVEGAPNGTVVSGYINSDTTWTQSGSPYQVDGFIEVAKGATLTIEAGVTVENYPAGGASQNYNFDVYGRLLAQGTAVAPIQFLPGPLAWSGIHISGTIDEINQGSVLEYVNLYGGGYAGPGASGNLVLSYSEVTVRHSQFNDSHGDGILGNDGGSGGVAHVSDSSFTNNAGYAISFENGSVNPVLSNLTATGNGASLPYGGNLVFINDNYLHGAHTWEYMGLPYLILSTIVAEDGVLTIEPGVDVMAFPGNDGLDIVGRLQVNGTAANPVRIRAADPQTGWSGVLIAGTDVKPSTGSLLDHVIISEGGHHLANGLYIDYGSATVTNSRIENSGGSGVGLNRQASIVMTDTQIIGNHGYAIDVWQAEDQFNLSGITASGNMTDTISIHTGAMAGNHHWTDSGIDTFDIDGYVSVAANGVLTIDPGLTLRFHEGRDMTVNGRLVSIGTVTAPILFTSVNPVPGQWIGVTFVGEPARHATGDFKYTTLEYGGYGGGAMVGIENADVNFGFCTLRYSGSDAIRISPPPPPASLTGLQMMAPTAETVHLYLNRLAGNTSYAINNTDPAATVGATYNWWGDPTGPTADSNPGGKGDSVYGNVHYEHFLETENTYLVYLPFSQR